MYSVLLAAHSWLRYAVLLMVLLVLLRSAAGLLRGGAWGGADEGLGRWLIRVWDLQFLLGLVLYFLSPITRFALVMALWDIKFCAAGMACLANLGETLATLRRLGVDRQLRVIAVEHPLLMLLATAALHVGWVRARNSADDRGRLLRWLLFVAAAALLTAIAIPWEGRPLLRTSAGPLPL